MTDKIKEYKERKCIETLGLPKVLILSSPDGDWEGLFINGNLIDEGYKLSGGEHEAMYWLMQSEQYGFKSTDIRIASVAFDSEDAEYLEEHGSFPQLLTDLKGGY